MWQIAVLARFEVLQSLLSSHERENVKSAVFELHRVTRVNAEIREEVSAANDREETRDARTATRDDNSAHLERWKKWKLEGEKIDKLTSTAATAALQLLETRVTNLRFFARGKRGVLYAGETCSGCEPVVAKLAASASCTASVTLEAQWLRVVNRMGLGPKLLDAGAGWFLCERLQGKNVVEFLAQADEAVSPANAVWVVREMLCQCFAMDLLGVNKDEMTHPHRHVIVHRSSQQQQQQQLNTWRCTFVDFEKCSLTRKPKNVTQLCQFLSSPRMVALLQRKRVTVDVSRLRQCSKRYKHSQSTSTFGAIMRVFGL
uniref:Uncharacterized protein n=1 Tax=Peronospora matthiolae TaxID=2874970 RepID=A0AAV1TY39_9STRA